MTKKKATVQFKGTCIGGPKNGEVHSLSAPLWFIGGYEKDGRYVHRAKQEDAPAAWLWATNKKKKTAR